MALSRIWAAFIIVAVLAATFQSVFIKGNSDIFSRMVTGKSGDTSQTRNIDSSTISAGILQTLQSGKTYTDGTTKYARTADGRFVTYKELHADGIIATSKTAVDI
jgi:hypothetical protein